MSKNSFPSYARKVLRLISELKSLLFMVDFGTFSSYFSAIITGFPQILKEGNLGPAFRKMEGRKHVFNVFGEKIVLDGRYFGRATELYGRKVYFMLPDFRLNKDMVVVDLGANVGAFTVLAAKIAKKVVAVEAIPALVQETKNNLEENNVSDKADVVWGVVGNGSGMFADPGIRKKNFGNETPPRIKMEEIMQKHSLEKIDFLKIDIEGSEFDLFKKVEPWMKKVDHIAMEAHAPFLSDGIMVPCGNIDDLRKVMESAGFEVALLDLNGKPVKTIKDEPVYLFAKRK